MKKLKEIAEDYKKVKNYVYARYGGISSLPKLYPGYTVQNEMTKSGLREQLGMPSVYFHLAILDALGDIKSQWSGIQSAVLQCVARNENLADEEKHFLRYLLKVSNAFYATLTHEKLQLPAELQNQYDMLAADVDVRRLGNYLCRQVRKRLKRLHTDRADGFSLAERAYRYGNHGIYISVKEKRKRIFIPLTDSNVYDRQLYLKLLPEENSMVISVPIDMAVRKQTDYTKQVGIALGMQAMLVTDQGQSYGERFGEYQSGLTEWLWEQSVKRNRNQSPDQGRKKYQAKKHRMEEQLHSYVNQELNRFLKCEKPEVVYIPKLPPIKAKGKNKKINYSVTTWQRGYVRRRLFQKCQEQSVKVVEVFAKDISNVCGKCGAIGIRKDGDFICPNCHFTIEEKTNAALNARNRGQKK